MTLLVTMILAHVDCKIQIKCVISAEHEMYVVFRQIKCFILVNGSCSGIQQNTKKPYNFLLSNMQELD